MMKKSEPLWYCKAIDLTRNQITSLKDFQSDTVANLIVTENSLQSIDGIEQLPQLTTLIASINQISVLWSRDMDQLPDLPLEHLELVSSYTSTASRLLLTIDLGFEER